jgi:release factor glutamine methyltransferase
MSTWADRTNQIYELTRSEREAYTIEVLGRTLVVLPEVFSPKYCKNSLFFTEYVLQIIKGKSLLDMGCGTGITSVLSKLNGASRVVATDINQRAVENCLLNAELNMVDVDVRLSDLFDSIGSAELFDVIYWNHPFNYSEKQVDDMLMKAGFDYKYESLIRFLEEGKGHLSSEGRIILGSGGFARSDIIAQKSDEAGYCLRVIKNEKIRLWEGVDYESELIIYELI